MTMLSSRSQRSCLSSKVQEVEVSQDRGEVERNKRSVKCRLAGEAQVSHLLNSFLGISCV
jgi:hypothetical protein